MSFASDARKNRRVRPIEWCVQDGDTTQPRTFANKGTCGREHVDERVMERTRRGVHIREVLRSSRRRVYQALHSCGQYRMFVESFARLLSFSILIAVNQVEHSLPTGARRRETELRTLEHQSRAIQWKQQGKKN